LSDQSSSESPTIQKVSNEEGGAYSMEVEGAARPAVLTWKAPGENGENRVVDHTFTPPEARGKGLAGLLVEAIVADARAEGFKIAPQCPCVVHKFGKNPEWEDIRAPLPR